MARQTTNKVERMSLNEVIKEDIISQLIVIIERLDVEQVVVGLPLNKDGSDSFQSRITTEFAKRLKERVEDESKNEIQIYLQDERYTSSFASS